MCLVAQLGHKYRYLLGNALSKLQHLQCGPILRNRTGNDIARIWEAGEKKRKGEGKGGGIGEQLTADTWGV